MTRRFSGFSVCLRRFVFIASMFLVWTGAVSAQQATQTPLKQQMVWVDRAGNVLEKIGDPQWTITGTVLSPDEKMIAVRGRNVRDGNDDIWVYDLERKIKMQATFHPSDERQPCWSPDGRTLIYFSYRNGPANLYTFSEREGEQEFLILPHEAYAPTWSSDGKYVLYHYHDQTDTLFDNRDLWYVDAKERTPVQFINTPKFKEAMPRFSPDGKYVSFIGDETGKWEAYVKAFPSGETVKVSTNGGIWPRWNGKGDEIYFWEGNTLMVVSVKTEPKFSVTAPKKLFSGEQVGMGPRDVTGFNIFYDVARDGQRFVVVQNSVLPRRGPQ